MRAKNNKNDGVKNQCPSVHDTCVSKRLKTANFLLRVIPIILVFYVHLALWICKQNHVGGGVKCTI